MNRKLPSALALAFALGLGVSGCYAHVTTHPAYDAPPPTVVVTPAPFEVEAHPYVFYEGGPVYWVDGRWYRRWGNGWVYYRSEPPYLAQRRPGTITAPPAYPRNPPPPARPIQPPPARPIPRPRPRAGPTPPASPRRKSAAMSICLTAETRIVALSSGVRKRRPSRMLPLPHRASLMRCASAPDLTTED